MAPVLFNDGKKVPYCYKSRLKVVDVLTVEIFTLFSVWCAKGNCTKSTNAKANGNKLSRKYQTIWEKIAIRTLLIKQHCGPEGSLGIIRNWYRMQKKYANVVNCDL